MKKGKIKKEVTISRQVNVLKTFHWVDAILTLWASKHPNQEIAINKVYKAFANLKKKEPAIFKELDFAPAGYSLHSKQLEDILNMMSAWGSISVENPRFINLKIIAESEKISDDLSRFSGLKYKKLESLNKTFSTLVK